MAIHAVEHTIYNPIARKKGNWTVTNLLMGNPIFQYGGSSKYSASLP